MVPRFVARTSFVVVAVLAAVVGTLPGCASKQGVEAESGVVVRGLGESFPTSRGDVYVIRVQDEYKLVRCIVDGPIAGCYEDVLTVPREALSENSDDGIGWNRWIDVPQVPGLQVAFVAPGRVAVRDDAGASPR